VATAAGSISITYGPDGQIVSTVTPLGAAGTTHLETAYGYDALGDTTTITTNTTTSGTTTTPGLASYTYSVNAAGAETGSTASYANAASNPVIGTWASGTSTYGYDPNGRLASATTPALTASTYTWNAMPDRSTVTTGSTTSTTTFDKADRPKATTVPGSGSTYSSDKEGRLTSGLGKNYKWDNLGRLVEVDNSSGGSVIATYAYDPLDRLVSEVVGGVTTTYAYVGLSDTVATVTTSSGSTSSTKAHITDAAGNDLAEAALTRDGSGHPVYSGPTYLGRNGHGDVVWQADATGAIAGTTAYDPFGAILYTAGSITTGSRWQSSTYDSASGLYYVIARWYSPGLGRFLSTDPVAGSSSSPQTLDPYSYGAGDSIGRSDPSGRCWGICIDFNPVAAIQSAASTVTHAATSVVSAAVSTASSAVSSATSWASSTYNSVSNWVVSTASSVTNWASSTYNSVSNWVVSTASSGAQAVSTAATSVAQTVVTQATAAAHAAINSPLNPVAGLSQVVHALNSAASSVAPVFQSTIIAKLPGPLQTVWSDLSSPAAFTLGFTQGALDGSMSVFDQMADSIPALASTASSVTSCAIFMSCSGLASDLSSAAQAVSTADPAKIIDSAKHFVLDPFADIANHAASGDWNGAGVASGHVAVAVVQVALAVSGICEAVMADSCFLPSLADVMDLADAATGVTGADVGSAPTGGTTLFRAVGPAEAVDIEETGTYRIAGASAEYGKYFFPTQEQAQAMVDRGWAAQVTSAEFPQAAIHAATPLSLPSEGSGLFIPKEFFPWGPVNILGGLP
jgi:RHS repeat-associated protein